MRDKLKWLNWFLQFLCERLSSFNPKRFYYSYAWSCSLCEKKTYFCIRIISRKLCGFLPMFSTSFTSLSVTSSSYWSSSSPLSTVFDSILSNIDEVPSINPPANVFVFGDFNVHQKDWITYSHGTDRLGELYYAVINFLSQLTLLSWLTFLLGSLTVVLTVLLFWMYLFLLMLVFVLR